jgi:hypothetical protein
LQEDGCNQMLQHWRHADGSYVIAIPRLKYSSLCQAHCLPRRCWFPVFINIRAPGFNLKSNPCEICGEGSGIIREFRGSPAYMKSSTFVYHHFLCLYEILYIRLSSLPLPILNPLHSSIITSSTYIKSSTFV